MNPANPAAMDRDEDRRVQRMAQAARRRPHLTASVTKQRGRSVAVMSVGAGRGVLKYSSQIALGDAIRRRIERREAFEAMQGVGVEHVRNGKPLTPKGAAMLGVAWTSNA